VHRSNIPRQAHLVITRALRAWYFGVLFSLSSALQSLGSKMRGKNLHITLTYLGRLTIVEG